MGFAQTRAPGPKSHIEIVIGHNPVSDCISQRSAAIRSEMNGRTTLRSNRQLPNAGKFVWELILRKGIHS